MTTPIGGRRISRLMVAQVFDTCSVVRDVQFNAAIGAIPHTGDKMLVGAERAAAQLLRIVAAEAPGRT